MSTASRKRWLLVGGFLCSTVLTGCVSQNKYAKLEGQNEQLQRQVAEQSRQLAGNEATMAADKAQIAAHEAQLSRLQGAIKYTVESDLLFAPGSWELREEGKDTIGKLASKLAPTQENQIVVNGFTDNVPIGEGLERKGITSNDELSQKRAEAVREFLISQGLDPSLVTAVGHGASNPVATNDTAEGRSKNRRVELSLGG